MTIEKRTVTVCDYCGDFEWGIQNSWRVGTRHDDLGKAPVHLCPKCRASLYYCQDCEDFHWNNQDCPLEAPDPPTALDDPAYYSLNVEPLHEDP